MSAASQCVRKNLNKQTTFPFGVAPAQPAGNSETGASEIGTGACEIVTGACEIGAGARKIGTGAFEIWDLNLGLVLASYCNGHPLPRGARGLNLGSVLAAG